MVCDSDKVYRYMAVLRYGSAKVYQIPRNKIMIGYTDIL